MADAKGKNTAQNLGKSVAKWAPRIIMAGVLVAAFSTVAPASAGVGLLEGGKNMLTNTFSDFGSKLGDVYQAGQNSFHSLFPTV